MKNLEVWAHRGGKIVTIGNNLSGNTLDSFMTACDMGVDGIEVDIAPTKDGEAIIYHPKTLRPDPIGLGWAETRSRYPYIMHFDDFLYFLDRCNKIQCCLDLKNGSGMFLEKIITKINVANLHTRIFVTASQIRIKALQLLVNDRALLETKRINPFSKIHVVGILPYNLRGIVQKVNANAISIGWLSEPTSVNNLTKFFFQRCIDLNFIALRSQIKELQDMGVKVWGGIANTRKEMEYFTELGVDGFFTDAVDLAMKYKVEG